MLSDRFNDVYLSNFEIVIYIFSEISCFRVGDLYLPRHASLAPSPAASTVNAKCTPLMSIQLLCDAFGNAINDF